MVLESARLRLRPLVDADVAPWVALFTNPDVMQFVSPEPLSRERAEAAFSHYRAILATKPYGWWAIELKDGTSFAGVILLQDVGFSAAFTPAIEIGWDLLPQYWGYGYATEGARTALDYAFTSLKLKEVVAITATGNARSQRVLERLGMSHDPNDDFDHPHFADGPFRRALLFRLKCPPDAGSE